MFAQGALEELHVETIDVEGHVRQGVVGHQIEADVGVAQGQVEIDQGNAVAGVHGQGGAEVDREGGGADATPGAEYGDDHRLDPSAGLGDDPAVGGAGGSAQTLKRLDQFFED